MFRNTSFCLWGFIFISLLMHGCDRHHTLDDMFLLDGEPVTKLSANQFQFTEGPAWDGEYHVYFTDLNANEIHRWHIPSRTIELVRSDTLETNGLMFSPQGDLWGAVHKMGSVIRMDKSGKQLWTVAGGYQGKSFNQPNDLALDAEGGVYLTDPSWDPESKRNQVAKGVYYVNAAGEVTLLVDDMDKPNGVLVANKGAYLYVVDMGTDEFRRYSIQQPGKLGEKEVFATFRTEDDLPAAPDGLAADVKGNLFVATSTGVQVFSPHGDYLGLIRVPERPSNVAFYGKARNALFITALTNVYSIKLNTTGDVYPLIQ